MYLRTTRRRFAGGEGCSRISQAELNRPYGRVRISEQAPRNRLHVLERNNCLAEVVERGGGVVVERHRVTQPHPEREVMTLAVEACAEDTKGQTCYICTQALHWKTKEGLVRGCACRGTAGFAHVSCLAEQAKILYAEAEDNNLDWDVKDPRWIRWSACSLCEQNYHGFVRCAMGWACWKTYLGRPEIDEVHDMAMNLLGNGLHDANHYKDALAVREAELSMLRRIGRPEEDLLTVQGNLASTYEKLGQMEPALDLQRDVYFGFVKLYGEEHYDTLREANNYASSLLDLERCAEAKSLMRKMIPVARRLLGESIELTLKMRVIYAGALYLDASATLDDLREAVTTLEDTARIARRVFGGAHPLVAGVEGALRESRAVLRSRDDVNSLSEAVAAMPPPGN